MYKKYIAFIGVFIVIVLFFRSLSSKNGFIKSAATARPPQKSAWSYPMTKFATRGYLKKFGEFIDEKFYAGREELFPTQYFGYHSGQDLEILKGEENKDVAVYAVALGEITFIGEVSGYGGVILEKLDGTNHTALYGHVRIYAHPEESLELVVEEGEKVQAGQKITVLGNAFSEETGGERKHLHFAIHKGTDLYFLGHEQTKEELNLNWVDPTKFLKDKGTTEQK